MTPTGRGCACWAAARCPRQIGPGDRLDFDLFWQSERDGLGEMQVRLALAQNASRRRDVLRAMRRSWPGYSTANGPRARCCAAASAGRPIRACPTALSSCSCNWSGRRWHDRRRPSIWARSRWPAGRTSSSRRRRWTDAPAPASAICAGCWAIVWKSRMPGTAYLSLNLDLNLILAGRRRQRAPYTVSVQLLDAAASCARSAISSRPRRCPTTSWVPARSSLTFIGSSCPRTCRPARISRLIVRMYDPATMAASCRVTGAGGPSALGDSLPLAEVRLVRAELEWRQLDFM